MSARDINPDNPLKERRRRVALIRARNLAAKAAPVVVAVTASFDLRPANRERQFRCSECGRRGHSIRTCPEKTGVPLDAANQRQRRSRSPRSRP